MRPYFQKSFWFNSTVSKLELSAVCDIDGDVLNIAKAEYDVQGYTELKDMLSNEILDLVVLCTPSGLRPSQPFSVRMACTSYQNLWRPVTKMV